MQLVELKLNILVDFGFSLNEHGKLVKFSIVCGTQDRLMQIMKSKKHSAIHAV